MMRSEQLVSKGIAVGTGRIIAISSSAFRAEAKPATDRNSIEFTRLADVGVAVINASLQLGFVLLPHKRCGVARSGVRKGHSNDRHLPRAGKCDYALTEYTGPVAPVDGRGKTGTHWSLNDLSGQIHEARDPFGDVDKATGRHQFRSNKGLRVATVRS